MNVKNDIIDKKNINYVISILNNSYNITNIFFKFFDNILYSKNLLGNKILFLCNNDNEYIGMLIYEINKFDKFSIVTIEELCIIKKYKLNGFSKILLNSLLNKINKKYKNCYLATIICDLRSLSNDFINYEILYPYVNKSNDDSIIKIINTSKSIIIKWYMIEMDKQNGIYHIPFYKNNETYKIFNSKTNKLNSRQQELKKFLKDKKYYLGYGIGVFYILKIC